MRGFFSRHFFTVLKRIKIDSLNLFMRTYLVSVLVFVPAFAFAQTNPNKTAVITSVEKHQQELINLSDSVWKYAETALKEYRSSKALSDYATKQGFRVTTNVAGMPTAFIAEYGSGKPVIAILGEFDALPGLSQKAQPTEEAIKKKRPVTVADTICSALQVWVQPLLSKN
jgi:aminobenzoyl-glutamate utilization protein B